jgi:hypothetical protein
MIVNEVLQAEFVAFLSCLPARRLKQNTMRILLSFLDHEHARGLPDYMGDLYTDLLPLFHLLDSIDSETDQSHLL